MTTSASPDKLDRLLHEPVRLSLALALEHNSADFTYLKNSLGLTDGNLMFHLRVLSEAGYLTASSTRHLTRRVTLYGLTPEGRVALSEYRECMLRMLE
jgi:DNA-binding MarR family transcriptional regulator